MIGILIFNCTKKSWNCHCFGCLPCPRDTREHDNLEPFLSESLPQVALFSFWLFDFVLFSWYNLSPQLCVRIQCVALAHGSSDSCFEVNNMHHATSSFFIHILQKYNSNRRFDLCSYVGDVSWAPYSRYPSTCLHTPDHHNTPPVFPIFGFATVGSPLILIEGTANCFKTSTVFATVSGDGRVTVFDLSTDKYTPVCRLLSTITGIRWKWSSIGWDSTGSFYVSLPVGH